jgi:hypothetical protein
VGRLKRVFIAESDIFRLLQRSSEGSTWAPYDAHIVGIEANTAKRGIEVVLRSDDFEVVDDGEPIPDRDRVDVG